ncbi:DUF4405 domain-containing protein [Candidatus Woesearchaeota archaeon]|nr:MAG: DUF4405 domain-containing protein [Candidatus Woesearchaeota archaeon]
MASAKVNYVTDFVMFLGFLIVGISGVILLFWRNLAEGKAFLYLSRHTWLNYHKWVGLFFVIIVVLHFAFHWKWVVCMTKSVFKK